MHGFHAWTIGQQVKAFIIGFQDYILSHYHYYYMIDPFWDFCVKKENNIFLLHPVKFLSLQFSLKQFNKLNSKNLTSQLYIEDLNHYKYTSEFDLLKGNKTFHLQCRRRRKIKENPILCLEEKKSKRRTEYIDQYLFGRKIHRPIDISILDTLSQISYYYIVPSQKVTSLYLLKLSLRLDQIATLSNGDETQ